MVQLPCLFLFIRWKRKIETYAYDAVGWMSKRRIANCSSGYYTE